MNRVDVPMNDWSRPRLEAGEKTGTTRAERYGSPGDVFDVDGIVYEITHVVRLPLGIVAEHFYEIEGASTRQEFVDVWEDIHFRRGFDPEWEVWLHLFRKVTSETVVTTA